MMEYTETEGRGLNSWENRLFFKIFKVAHSPATTKTEPSCMDLYIT